MSRYDEDADSGDISLSFPVSRSSPSLSTIVRDAPPTGSSPLAKADDATPGPSNKYAAYGGRSREVSSPTPQRVLTKGLFGQTVGQTGRDGVGFGAVRPGTEMIEGRGSGSSVPGSRSTSTVSSSYSGSVSLNDSPTGKDRRGEEGGRGGGTRGSRLVENSTVMREPVNFGTDDDRDPDTPLGGGSSFWGIDGIRPSSADPRTSSATFQPHNASGPGTGSGPGAGTSRPMTRRTSSNTTVGRSRSLHLHTRLPSYDLTAAAAAAQEAARAKGKDRPIPSSAVDTTPSMRLGWSRKPGEPRPPPLVNGQTAEKMERWIKEIVVCNFDLERGPVVERRLMGRRWGPGEKENVAFSSFPDTSLFSEGSIVFSFKIRHIPPDPKFLNHPEPPSPMPDLGSTLGNTASSGSSSTFDALLNTESGTSSTPTKSIVDRLNGPEAVETPSPVAGSGPTLSTGEKAEEYRKWDERGREWLYGFVWFEQRRDGGLARGYMQKSLVILTHLPFPSLFSAILHRIAPMFFEHGYSALEAACHSIASWPDPTPDRIIDLPLMSDIITVKLPDTKETPQLGHAFDPPSPHNPILASLPASTPLRTFASFLPSLWSLWECLVLAEPVLVIAPNPRMCSEIVWWLRDLMRPIPPSGDFRPYLHIHDHDFSLLVNSNKPQPGIVVGVTNPFFRNAASHWPNVISISSPKPTQRRNTGGGPGPGPARGREQPDGFISRRHRSVSKDRPLLKRLEALVAAGRLDDPAGNEALRTHFQQLTERMLVPLNRYFQTLVPTIQPSPSPGASPNPNTDQHSTLASSTSTSSVTSHSSTTSLTTLNTLKPFSLPTFLSHLKTHGPNPLSFRNKGLTSKSRVESDFYASFCMSATFPAWLASRVESLGIAVAAQANTGAGGESLSVPVPGPGSRSMNDMTPTKARYGATSLLSTSAGATDLAGYNPGLEGRMASMKVKEGDEGQAQGEHGSHANARAGSRGRGRAGSVGGRVSMSDASTASTDWRESGDSAREDA